jgi:hypothetical protein
MTEEIISAMFLNYAGPIDFQIKKEILSVFKEKLDECLTEPKVNKRCTYMLEELLTNAHEYYKRHDLENEAIKAVIKLLDSGEVELHIANVVLKTDTDELRARVEEINNLSQDALKKLYEQAIIRESEGNGGVGLITVKLKAGSDYGIKITAKNEDQNIFRITTTTNLGL